MPETWISYYGVICAIVGFAGGVVVGFVAGMMLATPKPKR